MSMDISSNSRHYKAYHWQPNFLLKRGSRASYLTSTELTASLRTFISTSVTRISPQWNFSAKNIELSFAYYPYTNSQYDNNAPKGPDRSVCESALGAHSHEVSYLFHNQTKLSRQWRVKQHISRNMQAYQCRCKLRIAAAPQSIS